MTNKQRDMTQDWIPVTDRMPEPGLRVWVMCNGLETIAHWRKYAGAWEEHPTLKRIEADEVTHWQEIDEEYNSLT